MDFDETLMQVDDRGWMNGEVYGEPVPGAIEALRLLAAHRAVFVYTYAVSDMSLLRSSGAIQIKRSGRAGLAGVLSAWWKTRTRPVPPKNCCAKPHSRPWPTC
ncbi:hypothetical protein [Kitasatospora sp. NPDC085879]|uniref:hypothetical protein n=1 Tax=Kitasatospora sp. NPDC085879 TaxID=3154769 RepID=UPI00343C3FFF